MRTELAGAGQCVYTSHEVLLPLLAPRLAAPASRPPRQGLHLELEEAMTREQEKGHECAAAARKRARLARGRRAAGAHYNVGAHFLWLGERTRRLDQAHVEYFRGIRNPIGAHSLTHCNAPTCD